MVTATNIPHFTIATIHEFKTMDGRPVRVDLTSIDARAIAEVLANRAMRGNRRKTSALGGALKATITVGEAK